MPGSPQSSFRPCLSCGARNPLDADECRSCGRPLEAIAGRTSLGFPTRLDRLRSATSGVRFWVPAAAAVVAVSIWVLAYLLLTGTPSPAPTASQAGSHTESPAPSGGTAGQAAAPEGLAAPVGEAVRSLGYEPQVLTTIPSPAGGKPDGVLLGVRGLDRDAFRRLIPSLLHLFPKLKGEGDLAPLRRLSLVLTDTQGIVHKHELSRDEAMAALTAKGGVDDLLDRFGSATYPAPEATAGAAETVPAPSGGEATGLPGERAAPRGPAPGGPAPGPSGAGGGKPEEHPSPAEEIRFRPAHVETKVLVPMVQARFTGLEVTVEGGEIVLRGAKPTLTSARAYMEQVDARLK